MSVVVETIVVAETVAVVAPPLAPVVIIGGGAILLGAAIYSLATNNKRPKPNNPPKNPPNNSATQTQTAKNSSSKNEENSNKTEKPQRTKTKEVDDPSSEQVEKTETADSETTPVWQHIVDRFGRYFRFAGMINHISDETDNQIDRHDIVDIGRTNVQDNRSGMGRNIHAAHVIRAGTINGQLLEINPILYRILANFIGHTQNVPRWANEWNGLGGDIDRFQEKFRHLIIDIRFDGNLTTEIYETIELLKNAYLDIIMNWIKKTDGAKKAELEKAKEAIENMKIEDIFQKGKKGRDGDYNPFYI